MSNTPISLTELVAGLRAFGESSKSTSNMQTNHYSTLITVEFLLPMEAVPPPPLTEVLVQAADRISDLEHGGYKFQYMVERMRAMGWEHMYAQIMNEPMPHFPEAKFEKPPDADDMGQYEIAIWGDGPLSKKMLSKEMHIEYGPGSPEFQKANFEQYLKEKLTVVHAPFSVPPGGKPKYHTATTLEGKTMKVYAGHEPIEKGQVYNPDTDSYVWPEGASTFLPNNQF